MPSVARNTFYLTAALVGQKIISFVFFTVLARFLGARTIGTYTFALAFTTIFSILTDLGLTPVLIREVARKREQAQSYVRTIFAIKLVLSVCAYGAVLLASYFLHYPVLTRQLIAIAGIVMVLDTIHLTLYGILRGLQTLKYEAVGMVVGQGIALCAGIMALALHLPLHAFLAALALGSTWNVLLSYRTVHKQGIVLAPRFDLAITKVAIRYAIPFALSGIFVKVYSYIDTVLLQHMKGDLMVGWYSVPYKITYAFQFLPMALSAAIYPALSAAWKQDAKKMRTIFDRALLYGIFIVLPLVFGIAALAPEIIRTIYGAQFFQSIPILQVSIFGLVFIFLYFPVGALLNATDRQMVNTVCMGITMVLNIVLNLLLIPHLGGVGAAIAAVFTNAFLFFCTFFWSMRIIKPSVLVVRTFGKVLLAVIAMSVVVLEFKGRIFWPVAIVAGAAVYLVLLIVLRAIRKEDAAAFLKLLRKQPAVTPEAAQL